jgi:Fe-S-cluster-containing hydrogenase component 2
VDAIYLDTAGEPVVCLHCGKCVPYCPHGCLEMVERQPEPAPGQPGREEEAQGFTLKRDEEGQTVPVEMRAALDVGLPK